MKTSDRKTFIAIAAVLGIALAASIIMAAAWISSTYREKQEKFASDIESALSQAKHAESESRFKKNGYHVNVAQIGEDTSGMPLTYPENFISLDIKDIADVSVFKFYSYRKPVEAIFGMENPVDTLAGFVTNRFLLTFYNALDKMNIPEQDYGFTITLHDGTDTVFHNAVSTDRPAVFSTIIYDINPPLECRVETEDPGKTFLKQMSGIIISVTLIAIILCLSYIYLLRTVFRQKSLEKMREDFTHNITHELKTPIATASAATEALLGYPAGDSQEKRDKYLNIVNDKLKELSSMVERILEMTASEDRELPSGTEECSLQEILHSLCMELRLKYPQAVVSENVPSGQATVPADRFHLSNAIANILDNAAKYVSGTPRIEVSLETDGHKAYITVKDNGIGIPKSEREKIFGKYYRITEGDVRNTRGFGIGLYYSRSVISGLGGSITVSAPEEGGSIFKITLPCRTTEK